jgi:3-phosphoshikimate 1-carboxyvinyltransferase
MRDLFYEGSLSSSKSLFNRALIAQSFFPELEVFGDSKSEDIDRLLKALNDLKLGQTEFHVGDGGTTLRFLMLRLSRQPGEYKVFMSPSLKKRPHQGLLEILNILGVHVIDQDDHYVISTRGWAEVTQVIPIEASKSSQFASALLLNAWNLKFDLKFEYPAGALSESYFLMTLNFVRQLGMMVLEEAGRYIVPAQQKVLISKVDVEMDISSAFTLSCYAAVDGAIKLSPFPFHSVQPDIVFLDIFKKMNIHWLREGGSLSVDSSGLRKPVEVDLGQSPDLFPVLSALCAMTEGTSHLRGATHLIHKESDRLNETVQLLGVCGIECHRTEDGLLIHGKGAEDPLVRPRRPVGQEPFRCEFDPLHDHRMAMAAGLFVKAGWPLRIKNSNVVSKSFSDFWSLVRINL